MIAAELNVKGNKYFFFLILLMYKIYFVIIHNGIGTHEELCENFIVKQYYLV